jgi:putative oxidoreductase
MKNKEALTDTGLLCIRLALGAIFIAHGSQKLLGGGMPGFTEFLTKLGLPFPAAAAYVTAVWELGGGLLAALGLFSRIAALGLVGVMTVAIVKVHLPKGFFVQEGGYEFALALLAMALSVVIAGPGRFSLDQIVWKRREGG